MAAPILDTLDPNNVQSTGTVGNEAIQSSASPYTPLVSATTAGAQSDATDVTGELKTEAGDPNNSVFAKNPNEQFTAKPIVSTAQDTLANNAYLQPQNLNQAASASPTFAPNPDKTNATGYTPSQGVAVHGTVNDASLVQNQLKNVLAPGTNANGEPDWAQPTVAASNQRMNALGLGASTMAANDSTSAVLTAALPIAEQNAHTYALMNTQNVTNDQYTMLSNTSARNAAYQFNAKNVQQNDQFFSSLTNATQLANAASATAVSKYNAGQKNTVQDFNSNLQNTRDEFNASNQLVVDQSNVKWQRSINTANTAADNAANQANVKNAFNVQQGGLNDIWQQARDEASWNLTSSENSQNRGLSLVNSSLNRQTSYGILNSQLNSSMYTQLGNFGVSLLGGTSGISSGVKSLFTSSNSGSLSSSEVSSLTSAGGYSSGTGVSFGGGSDAKGGIITPESQQPYSYHQSNTQDNTGIDLTHDTPHLTNDVSGNPKINFNKYK